MPKHSADDNELRPSKSARKREHHAIQVLAEALMALPLSGLRQLELAERTREELMRARTMPASGSRNRQIRLLAHLLEQEDMAMLSQAVEQAGKPQREAVAQQHLAEDWRQRLLDQGESVISQLGAHLSAADLQQLRSLRADALEPHSGERAKRAYREIYRLLFRTIQQ